MHADHVFDCASFVVLLSTSNEILISPHEVSEYLLVAISCANKEQIFTKGISLSHSVELELCENVSNNFIVLHLNSKEE